MAPLSIKKMVSVVVLGFLFNSVAYGHAVSMLFLTIEFPRAVKTAPQYPMWYEGHGVSGEVNGNEVFYNVPINRMLKHFYLLFVEDSSYVLKQSDGALQQNTIDYLKSGTVYRIFELQLQGTAWRSAERLLAEDRAIPDNTIIIYMPPHYVDKLVGGKGLQLPHIMIKENIVELLGGSLEALQKKANELIIEAINMNTFHVPAEEKMWVAGNRRIIVPTV
jgi:hypothetical protein